jgi:stearoyl-CoA desaturase (Delta-9 desaturase)
MYSGLLEFSWWQYGVAALILTHITIISVTVFLHRHQAHRALNLHPVASHFFRFWLWLTTGMVTKEWAAIHRKHHAKCETGEDPHSPQLLGIHRVLWGGVFLYMKEARNRETLERYGHGTPDDWLERHVYAPLSGFGVALMALLDVGLFGVVPGVIIWGVQMLWIPFWAAGVINGVGHYWGYRSFQCEDASRNIVPWGIIIGGEELHNNHHAYATSAKFSNKWFELDLGWLYIWALQVLGLARVKKLAPRIQFKPKAQCDLETLQAIITHRYDVLAKFAGTLKATYMEEIARLKERVGLPTLTDSARLRKVKQWLHLDATTLAERDKAALNELLHSSVVLNTIYSMRQELVALWGRSNATREQLLRQLEDWCRRAESSEIAALRRFSRRLRCYA